MFRSCRFIILAVAGLILVGAGEPPKGGNGSVATQSKSDVQLGADAIAAAIRDVTKSPEKDGGCQDREDKRDSDLCAQWKAADAARDAANYAFWTLLISTVGTALLVWTLWETRETARRELRAYIRLEPIKGSAIIRAGEPFTVDLNLTNYGKTPAVDTEFIHAAGVRNVDWQWSGGKLEGRKNLKKATIHPNDQPGLTIYGADAVTAEEISRIAGGQFKIFARGIFHYSDVFGRHHYTQIAIEIGATELAQSRVMLSGVGNIAT